MTLIPTNSAEAFETNAADLVTTLGTLSFFSMTDVRGIEDELPQPSRPTDGKQIKSP